MNEILNNPLVKEGLSKLGSGLEMGAEEWVKYIQVKSLIAASQNAAFILIILIMDLILTRKIRELEKEEPTISGGLLFIYYSIIIVSVMLIMVNISNLLDSLTGYYAPVGRAVDDLIKAAAPQNGRR